jgi:hypothetical protein
VPELVPRPTAAPTVLVRVNKVANLEFQNRVWKQKLGEKTYELTQERAETCQLRSALALASLEVEELKHKCALDVARRDTRRAESEAQRYKDLYELADKYAQLGQSSNSQENKDKTRGCRGGGGQSRK